MKKIFQLSALLASLGTPLLVAAQTGINVGYIKSYSDNIIYVINYMLVPVLMAIAFIVFLFGVYKYFIQGAANDTERATGRQFTLWGIIGFVVILSLWGIVNLLMGTFGLSVGKAPPFPTIGGSAPAGGTSGAYNPSTGATTFGSGYTVTPAQNAALTTQYNAMQSVCGISSTSADCKAAEAAYSASYYSVYPNPAATTQNAQNTIAGIGVSCEFSSCAGGLTCDENSSSPTYQTCIVDSGASSGSGTDTSGTDQYYNYTAPTTVTCLDGSTAADYSQCPADTTGT